MIRCAGSSPERPYEANRGRQTIVHTTKIMDWFGDDFEKSGGETIPFLCRYLSPEKARR